MGVNSLITWAVIDPVIRVVITETQGSSVVETRASSLAFSRWGNAWASHLVEMWASSFAWSFMWDAGFGPCVLVITVKQRRKFRASRLGTAVMLRRGFQAPRLGTAVMLRRDFQALRLGTALVAIISLAPEIWILLSDDLSSVIYGQSTTGRHSISFSPQYSSCSQLLMSTSLMHAQSLALFFLLKHKNNTIYYQYCMTL